MKLKFYLPIVIVLLVAPFGEFAIQRDFAKSESEQDAVLAQISSKHGAAADQLVAEWRVTHAWPSDDDLSELHAVATRIDAQPTLLGSHLDVISPASAPRMNVTVAFASGAARGGITRTTTVFMAFTQWCIALGILAHLWTGKRRESAGPAPL
jgi:hypothetical protein